MMDPTSVCAFLRANFHPHADAVSRVGAGMFSQAFSFAADQQAFIVRLNAYAEDFQKDAFACQHFSAPTLPIPRVVRLGQFDATQFFAITERCAGRTLNAVGAAAERHVAPALFDALDAIRHADVSRHSGWGLTDATGNGLFASWREYLLSLYNQKFAFEWRELAARTFLERDMFEGFLDAMTQRLSDCPLEKYWVHGDFGFDNVMSDGERITGVLDWAETRLGDFVYDVACLDFWSKDVPYGDWWRTHAASQGLAVPHFAERMCCYMLHQGLGGMAIDALRGDERGYVRVRERTRSVLQPGRRAASDWTQ